MHPNGSRNTVRHSRHGGRPSHLASAMVLDDHPLILHALVSRLRDCPRIGDVEAFDCSRTFIAALSECPPDIAVVDFSLGPGQIDGLNLLQELRRRSPDTRLLVVSAHFDRATVSMAMASGAHGFLGKSQALADLVVATQRVLRGRTYVQPAMARELMDMQSSVHAEVPSGGYEALLCKAGLSAREHEVLRCCIEGMSTSQIAGKYIRHTSTISTQKKAALRKLGLKNLSELFRLRYTVESPTRPQP